jgi:hypothetical protein
MEIPKELKILGHKVKIIYPYGFKERTDLEGQWDGDTLEIRINDHAGGGVKRAESTILPILIEEILHGVDEMTGHKIFQGEAGHKALNGISEVLSQIIVDNFLRRE